MLKLPSAGLQSIGAIAATETMPVGNLACNGHNRAGVIHPSEWLHPRALAYLVLTAGLLLAFTGLRRQSFDAEVNSIWFLVADGSGVALALMIGLIGLAYYRSFGTRSLMFIAIGFIGSGIIDSVHLFQMLRLESQSLPVLSFSAKGWSSMAARLFQAIFLLVGWRASEGRISAHESSMQSEKHIAMLALLLLAFLLVTSLKLAAVTVLDHEAALTRAAKSGIGLLFMTSLVIFLRRGDWKNYLFQHCFVIALVLLTASQVLYLPFLIHAGDSLHLLGYALRLAGYFMVFVAMLTGTANLFRQASSMQLEDRINSLIGLNGTALNPNSAQPAHRHRITGSGTFELDLATGKFKGNQATIEMLNGLDGGALAVGTITQFHEMVHPDDRDRLIDALRRSQLNGELFKQVYRVRSAEDYRWLESIGGVESVDGRPVRLLGFLDDVTATKQVEQEKDRLYRELGQMIAAVDQYAVTATLDLDGTVRAANGLFCQFCGLEEDELIGRSFNTLLMADQGEKPAADLWQTALAGKTWYGHVSLCQSSAEEERVANASLSPHLDDNSKIDAVVFLGLDITARVAARRALEVSVEQHKKSNEELQMFAHIVSHDLQEPMRMVSSFMTLLERRHAADLNPEAREYIQFAVEGATRMRSLLDGLLEYSRVRSRDMVFEQIRLNKPVADAMANLALVISEREAQITVAALPEIRGDSAQLMQLFQNLISNGIKFCSAHPPRIAIGAHRDEGRWVVEVSDNGIGIDPAHYQRIFQIFSRLHSREAYPGTGVGLAVCKQIMERLGGHIEVESMPGQGTTFKLCF